MSVIAITDQFLNLCCLLGTSENKLVTPSTISDIISLLEVSDESKIPMMFQKKYQLAKVICSLKQQNFKQEKLTLLDEITLSGYFKDYQSYIQGIAERNLDDEHTQKAIETINQRKSYLSIFKNIPDLEEFLGKLKNQDFNSIDKTLDGWKDLIGNIHTNIVQQQRTNNVHTVSELDLADDDYEPVLNQIYLSYSGANSVSTGYPELDKYMNGGCAPSRLYIFAATSGGGKSVMLVNLLKNAVETNIPKDDEVTTFVYVTLENLIDESLLRLYCSLTRQTTDYVISNYVVEKPKIQTTIKAWLASHKCKVKFIYCRPSITSMTDIISHCEVIKSLNEKIVIKGVYVDYLDLLKSAGQQFDVYRLEMGQVAIDMKIAAVILRCFVATVTQLNRQAYDKTNKLGLSNMGESMKKVDHADFVALFQNIDQEADKTGNTQIKSDIGEMILNIEKNRSGPKNRSVMFRTNFSQFLIEPLRNPELVDMNVNNIQENRETWTLDIDFTEVRNKDETAML